MKIFSGSSHPELAKKIADSIEVPLGKIDLKKFSNGETYARFLENVRGCDTFLIQSLYGPINDYLMELLIMVDAAKRSSAARITVVIPHYAYARQDWKAASREPITAKLLADLLSAAGADRIIALDLHSEQIQGFFNIPVDALTALMKFIRYTEELKLSSPIVLAPDAGSAKKSTKASLKLGVDLAIVNKHRPKHGDAEAVHLIGDVKGKDCVVFEDMIDTGGTIRAAAKTVKAAGANSVTVFATHGIFSKDALEKIEQSEIDRVIITDSIPQKGNGKLEVLDISDLLGKAIKRCHNNESISSLFE
ncbi:MAG: ribose-phosphate pyrophosphokinase [Candidatus Diapherotrites archaeon]|uniref:ribose-phosphate diphosphokinase n=1 Tax=Candidatus Iainarchaeum sp. TaxID=3101447 RepID=A0A2D6LZS9_9ARCH|nr:ribose-phosphate pyrophosphokinase [Candidatus Diapherotrites archaeon]|tara:strand:- start:2195 stop:3112 length:918 start_codon:yes stop_codon:yes gene_type:complete